MSKLESRKKNTKIVLFTLVFLMVCLSFASVPIYRVFCQRTGYGGTTQVAYAPAGAVRDRMINVQFNADVNQELPWRFIPLQKEIKVRVGEAGLAFYQAENLGSTPIVGMAIYNVTPEKAGIYFNKVECFCFLEQKLDPGQVMDMPVQFFIDPDFADDENVKDITTITLSYTFYPFKG